MFFIKIKYIIALLSLLICGGAIYFSLFQPSETTYQLNDTTISGTLLPKDKRFSGNGKVVFRNGDTYTGKFKNGYFNGKGSFTAEDGWSYVGKFKKGIPEGDGTLITEFGDAYTGKFKNGVFQTP